MRTSIFRALLKRIATPTTKEKKRCYGPALMCTNSVHNKQQSLYIMLGDCVRLYGSFPFCLSLPNKHEK